MANQLEQLKQKITKRLEEAKEQSSIVSIGPDDYEQGCLDGFKEALEYVLELIEENINSEINYV